MMKLLSLPYFSMIAFTLSSIAAPYSIEAFAWSFSYSFFTRS